MRLRRLPESLWTAHLTAAAATPAESKSSSNIEPGAFVVLGGAGVIEHRKFDTLAEAVRSASDGDTIEVRGNGPFLSQPIGIQRTVLTIRAGTEFRPVIQLSPEAVHRKDDLLATNAALGAGRPGAPASTSRRSVAGMSRPYLSAPLRATNCRFCARIWVSRSPGCEFRICEFLDESAYVGGTYGPGARLIFENCLHRSGGGPIWLIQEMPISTRCRFKSNEARS